MVAVNGGRGSVCQVLAGHRGERRLAGAHATRPGCPFRETEIQNLCLAARSQKNVCRFDVAMDDAFLVRCIERVGDFDGPIQQELNLDGLTLDAVFQRRAFHHLHDDERPALMFADVMNHTDVGMIEGSGRPRLALKALERLGVGCELFRQELKRYGSAERGIFGLVNHSHPATAQLLQNAVVRNCSP